MKQEREAMPRANRLFQKGYVYHITHRCNHREFLLSFKTDKRRYRYWLYQAVQQYGLCVLNFMVTDNHIHLLVVDTGEQIISNSMRLIASRVSYDNHRRKKKSNGAFWEGRYFATAVQAECYLLRCMVYIDLNMVRCGVVSHPRDWPFCGYHELYNPRKRYKILKVDALLKLLGLGSASQFYTLHQALIDSELNKSSCTRDSSWTDREAVGNAEFVSKFRGSRLAINYDEEA